MKDLILLNNDLSIDIVKEKKFKYKKNIDFVLIPMNSYDMDNTFIVVEANKYMNFDYCDVSMRVNIICYDHNDGYSLYDNVVDGETVRMESIIELYNYIHSLDKFDFVNSVMAGNLENMVSYSYDVIDFSIKMYKDNNVTFEYVYSKYDDKINSNSTNYDYFEANFSEIYKKLKKIYKSISNIMSSRDLIDINLKKNNWRLLDGMKIKNVPKNNLYGIHLARTNSFYFIEPENYLKIYDKNSSVYLTIDIYDENNDKKIDLYEVEMYNNYDDLLDTMEWYDHITIYLDIFTTLEIIIYFKYLFMSMVLLFSDIIDTEAFNAVFSIKNSSDIINYYDKRNLPSIKELL